MRLNIFFLKSEKNKAISVVSLVVITLAVAFFYEGIMLHSRTIDQVILERKISIDSIVKDMTLYSLTPYNQRLSNLLTTHEGIPEALINQDRDTLYQLTRPLYEALKRENKHLQVMHYHQPDGRSFLRMHNPQKFGDDLREIRPAVQYVQQNKAPLTCYEIGIYGAFYRVIHPVFHQGTYAGVLELGIQAHSIMESIQKQIPDPITTFFIQDRWQKVTKPVAHEFLVFGHNTLNTHSNPLFSQLPADLDLSLENQHLKIDGNAYLLHAYPIFQDYQGETIGGFIVMQDISQSLAAKKSFILRSLIFACFLLTVALLVLYFSFGTLVGKLENSQSILKKTVDKLGIEVGERKQTEAKLYKSKKEWERTFDAIGDIVTIMDSSLKIIKANKTAYRLLNAEPGSLTGKFCYEVFSDRSTACDGCPGIDTIHKCQVHSAEIDHQNLDKKFLITTSPVPDETGQFTNIVHIAKDITEKKNLESKLRQAQKMEAIGTLAGGIAHDFNNILTAIYGYNQLALLKAGDDNKLAKDLKQVNKATLRARDLVTQILTFSRQTEHDKRPLHIAPIIKEALKLLRSSIPSTIKFNENITTQGNILADPTQIHQIIMNLATNADHAMMETGGILGVSLDEIAIDDKNLLDELKIRPGKYIRLEVSDTGFGMDAETKTKIFEPYFTTKEVGKGTGMGLAVVHGIVSAHHGHINVYSEPGQGTTFHIYLPMVDEEPVDYAPQAEPEAVRGGTERLIFIDDEEILVQLASEVLQTYGYTVTAFTDGILALQEFTKNPAEYDLVITDMSMPNMTGLQLTSKIKEIRQDLPIILCSGYGETIYKEKALAMGISRYMQKPLIMENLARAVRELLD